MSQKHEKLRRQVEDLWHDVAALKLEQTWRQHCISEEQRLWAERKKARQAREKAREYKRAAARLSLLLGLSIGAAAVLGVKVLSAPVEMVTPDVPATETGRLPGDDTPAREPETAENELIEAALLRQQP